MPEAEPPDDLATPAHVLEPASSGRAKCRGCGRKIEKASLRFGEQVENPYTDRYTTLWFHPRCAAYKRPEPFLTLADTLRDQLDDGDALVQLAENSRAHRRLSRLDAIEQAASGRASCRHCKERIEKDALRIKLVYFEAGRFEPSGFLHIACAPDYCELPDGREVRDALRHFNPDLPDDQWDEVIARLR